MAFLRVVALAGLLAVVAACGDKDASSVAEGVTTSTPVSVTSSTTSTTVVEQPLPTTCPDIPFAPNSDNTASDIQVKGVACVTADPVIRAVQGQVGKSYEMNSFSCVTTGQVTTQGLAYYPYPYTCTGIAGFDNQHILFNKY